MKIVEIHFSEKVKRNNILQFNINTLTDIP